MFERRPGPPSSPRQSRCCRVVGRKISVSLLPARRRHTLALSPIIFHCSLSKPAANMSRRAAIVEEFDDDTDLPLPMHLPNTGSRGPLLQELHISDDEFEPPRAGPASFSRNNKPAQSRSESGSRPAQADPNRQVTDITPYKSYVD